MTKDQPEIHRKKRILEYAKQIGNINKACRYFGIARSSFYEWRDRYRELGDEGLKSRKCCPHNHPNKTPDEVVFKIPSGKYRAQFRYRDAAGKRKTKGLIRTMTALGEARHIKSIQSIIGREKIESLERRHVFDLIDKLDAGPLAGKTRSMQKVHATLRLALKNAVSRSRLTYNPAEGMDHPALRNAKPPSVDSSHLRSFARFSTLSMSPLLATLFPIINLRASFISSRTQGSESGRPWPCSGRTSTSRQARCA